MMLHKAIEYRTEKELFSDWSTATSLARPSVPFLRTQQKADTFDKSFETMKSFLRCKAPKEMALSRTFH